MQKLRLIRKGGGSVAEITKRILRALVSDDVGNILSLTGKGSKSQAGVKDEPVLKLIIGKRCTYESIAWFLLF